EAGRDTGAGGSAGAYAAAALLALAPAIALLPKSVEAGVILAGPIFDHSKIAIVDEMARLGVPPGNPFIGEGASRLVYYYFLPFSAARLAPPLRLGGLAGGIPRSPGTALASLPPMMGVAGRLARRGGRPPRCGSCRWRSPHRCGRCSS